MKRADLRDPALTLECLLKAAEDESVVLTENGKARFLLEQIEEFDIDDLQILENPEFRHSIATARAQWERGEVITHEEVVKRLGPASPENVA